jgi:hypothetical protein
MPEATGPETSPSPIAPAPVQRSSTPCIVTCEACCSTNTSCDDDASLSCTACKERGTEYIRRACRHRSRKIENCWPGCDNAHAQDEERMESTKKDMDASWEKRAAEMESEMQEAGRELFRNGKATNKKMKLEVWKNKQVEKDDGKVKKAAVVYAYMADGNTMGTEALSVVQERIAEPPCGL